MVVFYDQNEEQLKNEQKKAQEKIAELTRRINEVKDELKLYEDPNAEVKLTELVEEKKEQLDALELARINEENYLWFVEEELGLHPVEDENDD